MSKHACNFISIVKYSKYCIGLSIYRILSANSSEIVIREAHSMQKPSPSFHFCIVQAIKNWSWEGLGMKLLVTRCNCKCKSAAYNKGTNCKVS